MMSRSFLRRAWYSSCVQSVGELALVDLAALAGLAAYTAILALVRPPGLRHAWAYVRTLH